MTLRLADDRDPARFPCRVSLGLRHTDLDSQKLVSNVAIAELFEDARTHFSVDRKLKSAFDPHRRVLTSLEFTFGMDARYPGAMDIAVGVLNIENSGWTLRLIALQNGNYVAGCDARFVLLLDDALVDLPERLVALLKKDQIGPAFGQIG